MDWDNRKLRLAGIAGDSIVDGPGIRMTLFAQGCPHHCQGCHNPETWEFDGGTWWTTDDLVKVIEENPLVKGVTFRDLLWKNFCRDPESSGCF